MHIPEKWACDECETEFSDIESMFLVSALVSDCKHGMYDSWIGQVKKQVCRPCAVAIMERLAAAIKSP